tara:strand:- start:3499 stop:4269 length:771 start_codon:yes stop_codon:yes gene_type:complete
MKKIELNKILLLGSDFRYFEDFSQGFYMTTIKGKPNIGSSLLDCLIRGNKIINELNLCPNTSREIQEFTDKIEKEYDEKASDLNSKDKEKLEHNIKLWYDRIKNSSKNLNIILLDNKYLLNPDFLLTRAVNFFKNSTWKKLTKITKRDLEESCKCILFELPTSAGILALRACESVLREYYKKKTDTILTGFIDWKTILDQLNNTNSDKTILGHLDYLRKNLRNKLNHPDAVLLQKEAENIFSMIITTIETMVSDSK